jgi:predicted RNA binding protein YcfA (HicA-like mRNA interferase family)
VSTRLPVVSGQDMIRVLKRLGYEVTRKKGDHVRLRHPEPAKHRPTTVPMHKELRRGTLLAIFADAGLTVDQLRGML